MLETKDIQRLALLARLEVSLEEAEGYRADLVKILEYVGELEKVDVAGAEPLHNVLGLTGGLRGDAGRILRDERLAGQLIAQVPHTRGGFIVVPRILYHEE